MNMQPQQEQSNIIPALRNSFIYGWIRLVSNRTEIIFLYLLINMTYNANGSLSEYLFDDGSQRPACLPFQHLILLRVLWLLLLQLYV